MMEFEDNKEFKAALEKMLADKSMPEFNPIREQEATIFGLLCIRTDANGESVQGKGTPIVCRKIPAPFQTLTGGQYLVIADQYFWNHVDEIKQRASLYHALMHISIEVPEKGEVKFGTRKPPVQAWPSEVAKFGAHTDALLDIREAMKHGANRFAENMKSKT
jgi:hypothetical protein